MSTGSGGGPELRHTERVTPYRPAVGKSTTIDRIGSHIEAQIGSDIQVWHEIVSDLIHLDVYHVRPGSGRDYHVLVTCGMSDLAMRVPRGHGRFKHAELMLALPAAWPLTLESFEDESHYWPMRLLKVLARMPHEYATWLGYGHTMALADPPEPLAAGVPFTGAGLFMPQLPAPAFRQLRFHWFRTVTFYGVIPLHTSEMQYKLDHGAEALGERLREAGVSELLDAGRPSVVR